MNIQFQCGCPQLLFCTYYIVDSQPISYMFVFSDIELPEYYYHEV